MKVQVQATGHWVINDLVELGLGYDDKITETTLSDFLNRQAILGSLGGSLRCHGLYKNVVVKIEDMAPSTALPVASEDTRCQIYYPNLILSHTTETLSSCLWSPK